MADENYSSLREAVNRIMGAPPGGASQQADQTVALAPKASYSQDLQTPTTTTAAISNTPYDPFAEQNAALAALQAQNTQLAAQVAPVAAAATVVPAQAARKPDYSMTLQDWTNKQHQDSMNEYYATGGTGRFPSSGSNYGKAGQTYKVDPATGNAISPEGVSAGRFGRAKYISSSSGPPVNPGPSAPWQASQAYWTRLAAYNA